MQTKEEKRVACRAYYAAHREELRAHGRAYYDAHREERLAQLKRHYDADPETARAHGRKQYVKHLDANRARASKYATAHPEERARLQKRLLASYSPERLETIRRRMLIAYRKHKLKKAYGLTPEVLQHMLETIDYRCQICGKSLRGARKQDRVHIDHDHASGKFRGLLCVNCNILLGAANDGVSALGGCITYLRDAASGKLQAYVKAIVERCAQWSPEGGRPNYWPGRNYGLSTPQFQALCVAQNHKCAICGKVFGDSRRDCSNIDHNHLTGEVRGLLCFGCNTALGHCGERVEVLESAIKYLSRPPKGLQQLMRELK
jgi:hypothetical protein